MHTGKDVSRDREHGEKNKSWLYCLNYNNHLYREGYTDIRTHVKMVACETSVLVGCD